MKSPRKELFSSHRLSPPLILPRSRRINRIRLKFKFLITIPLRAANSVDGRVFGGTKRFHHSAPSDRRRDDFVAIAIAKLARNSLPSRSHWRAAIINWFAIYRGSKASSRNSNERKDIGSKN